jgi:tetratricopeptide (TPR) repeat protein
VPFDVTQDGIPQSCAISRAHAAIELKKLKAAGIVEEKLSHVRRGKSRRKVYFLSPAGKARAAKVIQYVKDSGIKPMVDSSRISPELSSSRARRVRRSTELPAVKFFVGRKNELEAARTALSSSSIRVLSVRGIAGIGKTSLVAKLCTELTGQRIFWHTSKSWDAPRAIEDSLARFFSDNGCRRLSAYLSTGNVELGELSFLLNEELSENGFVFVFDDADIPGNLREFLSMFRQSCGSAKILSTSDSDPGFYDSADVVAKGEVVELELGGLDTRASLQLLKHRGIEGPVAEDLAKMTEGHPLSLEMVTASTPTEARYQLSKFLEEKFYSTISEQERSLLQFASVFPRPFPADAVPKGLRTARKGSMLREVAPGMFEIHASLREFVYGSMTAEEKARWHSAAADYYLRAGDSLERLYHLVKANRRLEAEMLIARNADGLLEKSNMEKLAGILAGFEPSKQRYRNSVNLLRARVASLNGDHDSALRILESVSRDEDRRASAEALVEMGEIKGRMGELDTASKLFSQALEKSKDMPPARAKALRGLGAIEGKHGNYERAQELLERSAVDAIAGMDQKGVLQTDLELGNLYIGWGKFREAIDHFSKCAAGFGPVELANVYVSLGEASARLGELDHAIVHLENAARLSDETGQPRAKARALTSLAEVLISTGMAEQAKESCFAALDVLTDLHDGLGISAAYAHLGVAERITKELDSSEEHLAQSIEALSGLNVPELVGARKLELGVTLREKGEPERASAVLEESRKLLRSAKASVLASKADEELAKIR